VSTHINDNVLDIRNLCVDFVTERGRVHALRDVSLAVPKGKIVGVVGESGCGKSTLIYSIVRLLAANADTMTGEIIFEGRDVLKLSQDEMRAIRGDRLSMVFQDPMTALNPVLSIGTQMIDIQYRQNSTNVEKRKRAIEMLSRVDIPDPESRLRAYPHQFSGGMRQRIAIAMALQAEPTLLIADEPTTALDATLEVQIIHQLHHLQHSMHCSILFISHHLGVIAELCDYVVVMYAGEVVEHGSVRDIFNNPQHPYSQKLLECDPARIPERTRGLPTIPGEIPDLVEVPQGCIFRNRCSQAFTPCGTIRPVTIEASTGHAAACHLVNQAQNQ